MTDNTTFFTKQYGEGFGSYTDADDLLHPKQNDEIKGYGATETQYLGFSIPEEGITSVNYLWHHPRLKSVTGGSMAWQGVKPFPLACELMDLRCYMDEAALKNDLHDYTLDNGYRARIIEPFKKFHISYNDEARRNAFDVELTAVMPPAMIPSGKHFEQVMRAKGEMTLRGKRYPVNGYCTRDRSWGEARPEQILPIPSTTWMNCVFSDDLAFHCNAIDHPDLNPLWKDSFKVDPDKVLMGGWVWRDGELVKVASARKKVTYNRRTMIPQRIELHMTDAKGRVYEAEGETINCGHLNVWMNVNAPFCLTRWTCDGKTGWGESQDIQWNDFVQAYITT